MSFPPPPPPPRPPSNPYPPPPGSNHFPPPPNSAPFQSSTPNAQSLHNGMNNLHIAPPGSAYPPQQHHHHQHQVQQQSYPGPPSQPRPAPPMTPMRQPRFNPPAPSTAPPSQFAPPTPTARPPPPPPNQNFGRPPPPPPNQNFSATPANGMMQTPGRGPPPPSPQIMQQSASPYPGAPAPGYPTQQMRPPNQAPPPPRPPPMPGNASMRPPPPPSPYNNAVPPVGYNQGAPHQSFQQTPAYPATPGAPGNRYPAPPPPRPPGPSPMPPRQPQPPLPQDQPKIDPSQIPRPPLFTRPNDNGPLPIFSPKAAAGQSNRLGPPPPADSRYFVNDDGNASPQLIRSNFYTVPMDRPTWHKIGQVDMGVICSPMALPGQEFVPTMGPQPEDDSNAAASCNRRAPLDPQRVSFIPGVPGKGNAFMPPPRCRSCGAYVNPYWDMNTNTCNFCGTRNAIGETNFDVVCLQKGTVDIAVDGPYITRPAPVQPVFLYALDLTCQHVEEYVVLLEQIGIDLGRHFQQQAALQELWQVQQQNGGNQPSSAGLFQQRPRIGVCFVASFGIVVVTPNGPQGMAQTLIMTDVTEEPFCHLPLQEWTFDLSTPEGVDKWTQFVQETLLEGELVKSLKKQAGKKNSFGLDGYELSCGGAAMAFCADALAQTGGRATWISSRRPNFGAGFVRPRSSAGQSRKQPPVTDAAPLQDLPPKTDNAQDDKAAAFYRQLQATCAKSRAVLDIIITSNPQHVAHQCLDLSTQGEICRATCGKLTWIVAPGMAWKEPLVEELRRPLLCFQGWDAVFKVRCSAGLQVKEFLSSPGTEMDAGGLAASPELDLSCVTPQTNIAVVFEHKIGGIPKKSPFVFIQSALLYTTLSGQRRVRVSTLALRPSVNVPDIFLSCDFTSFTTLFLRRAVARLRELAKGKTVKDLNELYKEGREDMLERIIKVLVSYRQNTNAINSPRGQLILPEKLQLLPLFGMCLLKSPMLRPSIGRRLGPAVVITPTNDERAHYAFLSTIVGPASVFLLVHPNVFSVGKPMLEGVGDWVNPPGADSAMSEISQASYHSFVRLPPTINASMTSILDDGIYLVDNGLVIYLFFGKDVPREARDELYHLPISVSLSAANQTLTDYGKRVRRVVWQLRSFSSVGTSGSRADVRPVFPPIIPCQAGNSNELQFEQDLMYWMVDDPNGGEKDYTDFLCKLHRLIREKIEPSKK
ncbi:transport protein SEC24 [Seminavis robusta]|uniref:Transport protein SEC24 n=1 Tax=Seminavis robusta TaxID=568900 RepID=A0A9N8I0H0_9STRA|nr:transport protein SEC24 [Seminavis robusta]|eukprot:Sro2694_g334870.1 transport protein SEC24 (1203) ;mRNA; r:6139-9747